MREHPRVLWREGLSAAWYKAAYQGLSESKYKHWALSELRALDGEDEQDVGTASKSARTSFPADLRDRILKSLSYACWKSLAAHAADDGLIRVPLERGTPRLVEKALCQGLGLHAAAVGRWDTRKMHMDGNKVLGAIAIVLKRDIQQIGFKGHRGLIWDSVTRTIGIIKATECSGSYSLISENEFLCVRQVVRHPLSDHLLGERRRDFREKIFNDVVNELNRNGSRILSRQFVAFTFSLWSKPYVYFRAGLGKGWEFLDDIAAGQAQ